VVIAQPNLVCNNLKLAGEINIAFPHRVSSINQLTVYGNAEIDTSGSIISNGENGNESKIIFRGDLYNKGEIKSENKDVNGRDAFFAIKFEGENIIEIKGNGNFDLKEVVIERTSKSSIVNQKVALGNVQNYSLNKGTLILEGNFSQQIFKNDGSTDVLNDYVSIFVDDNATLVLPDAVKIYGNLTCEKGTINVGSNKDEGIKIDYFNAKLEISDGDVNVQGNVDVSYGSLTINDGSLDIQIGGEQMSINSFYVSENGALNLLDGEITIHNGSQIKNIFSISPSSTSSINGLVNLKNESNLNDIRVSSNTTFSLLDLDLGSETSLQIVNSAIEFSDEIIGNFKNIKIFNSSVTISNKLDKLPLFETNDATSLILTSDENVNISDIFTSEMQTLGSLTINIPNGKIDISEDLFFSNNSIEGSLELIAGEINIINDANIITEGAIINNGGTFNVKDGSNIFQLNNIISNFGDITIEKKEVLNSNNFNYWSSPVDSDEFKPINVWNFGNSDDEYNQDELQELIGTWNSIDENSTIKRGRGLVVPGPNNSAPKTLYFKGILNNGDIPIDLIYNESGYNLVGNPYPSSLNFVEFLKTNEDKVTQGIYSWNHVDGSNNEDHLITSGLLGSVPANSINNNQIKTSQGFVVKLKDNINNSVVFNNSQRLTPDEAIAKTLEFDGYKLWISLEHNSNENQMMIAALNGASNDVDKYDVAKFDLFSSMSISSIVSDELFKIHSLDINTDEHIIPLNIITEETGVYKISKVKFENNSTELAVQLHDKQNGYLTNLLENSYEFNISNTGDIDDRFEIIISHSGQLSTESLIASDFDIITTDTELTIRGDETITSVQAISMDGKSQTLNIIRKTNNESIYDLSALNNGIYIIYAHTDDGRNLAEKIIK